MCVLDDYGINQHVCKSDLSYYNQLRAFLGKLCFRDAAICDASDLAVARLIIGPGTLLAMRPDRDPLVPI